MQLLLGLRPPQQPLSDAALMLAIRKGEIETFGQLYRRHYAAVQAYAFQCMAGPLHAQAVTSHVFAGLLQQILAGESLVERRHAGCLRPHLLGNVRTTAIAGWHKEPETLSPNFRDWVTAGSRWPWGEDGQLALAFERLPTGTQRLLWHSVVERDATTLTARITGLPPRAVPSACEQARSALRQARTDLYLDRLERQDCRDTIRRLTMRPEPPPETELAEHFRACPSCESVYKDVTRLDKRLETQLPVRMLGWWTGEQYLRAKAAIPVPLSEPPFMARLVERLRADAPVAPLNTSPDTAATSPKRRGGVRTSPLVPRRFRADVPTETSNRPAATATTAARATTSATTPGRHRKGRGLSPLDARRSAAAVAIGGFLAGVSAALLLLAACQEQGGQQKPSPPASGPSYDQHNVVSGR